MTHGPRVADTGDGLPQKTHQPPSAAASPSPPAPRSSSPLGSRLPISTLKAGDRVKATGTTTGKTSAQTVAAVLVNHDSDLYDLKVKTADGTAVIQTTSNHLFWDASSRWVKATALKYGTHHAGRWRCDGARRQ